jgi:hypothetical protein
MRHIFTTLFIALSIGILIGNATAQTAVEPIDGWKITRNKDTVTLSPNAASSTNQAFIYRIDIADNLSGNNNNWFETLIEKDLSQSNWKEKTKELQNKIGSIKTYVVQTGDNSSKTVYVAYLAYIINSDKIRVAKMHSFDKDYFLNNFKIATLHFVNLAQKDGAFSAGTTPDKPINQPTGQQNNPIETNLKFSDIHSVIIHLEYESGLGGAVYPVYDPYILFKDGTIYSEPDSLDLAASKRNDPKKWGVWRPEGGLLKITWNAKPDKYKREEWKKDSYKNVSPAKKGETISGSFKTMSGGGNTALGGDVMVVSSNTITFNDQGQFTLAKIGGGSSSTVSSYYKGQDAGTYTPDGYTIELRFNGGKTERKFFYFYPDDRKYFGIGTSVYVPRTK